jgi:hypothetical protein
VPLEEHGVLRELSVALLGASGAPADAPRRDEPLTCDISFTSRESLLALDASVYLIDRHGARVVNENLSDVGRSISGPPGRYRVRFELPAVLSSGEYVVGVWLGMPNETVFHADILRLPVLPLPEDRDGSVHGLVRPDVKWTIEREGP